MALKDVRTTGVLVHRNGHWLVAQFHISMPVGGQAVPLLTPSACAVSNHIRTTPRPPNRRI